MKKLYMVHIEDDIMVMAENEKDAEDVAVRGLREEDADPDFVDAALVEGLGVACLPKGWQGCLPWGGDDDRTCEQILKDSNV